MKFSYFEEMKCSIWG